MMMVRLGKPPQNTLRADLGDFHRFPGCSLDSFVGLGENLLPIKIRAASNVSNPQQVVEK